MLLQFLIFLALNCLDTGYSCQNGGQCIPRVLGDYVCSCPQPYCGLTCTNVVPKCKIKSIMFDKFSYI